MSGPRARSYVTARVQERVCECPVSAVFDDDFGVCVKCGHQAEPEPPAAPSWIIPPPPAA